MTKLAAGAVVAVVVAVVVCTGETGAAVGVSCVAPVGDGVKTKVVLSVVVVAAVVAVAVVAELLGGHAAAIMTEMRHRQQ